MSQRLRTVPSLALIAAMVLAAPALARDLIVIDGPVTAKKLDCNGCVKRKNLKNNSVSDNKLRNNSVTSGKIQNGAVGTTEIQDGAVGTADIQDGAVTGAKIANSTITEDKLAFSAEESAEIAPFRVLNSTGGLCDSDESQGSSRPKILIDNDGLDNFVVTSIMIKTSGIGVEDFVQLSIESLSINGFEFYTPTGYLVGSSGDDREQESADLMGTPVRLGVRGSTSSSSAGGNFPHQIVAAPNTEGADIEVTLYCYSKFTDFSILAISVGGWKYEDDVVSVTYISGD